MTPSTSTTDAAKRPLPQTQCSRLLMQFGEHLLGPRIEPPQRPRPSCRRSRIRPGGGRHQRIWYLLRLSWLLLCACLVTQICRGRHAIGRSPSPDSKLLAGMGPRPVARRKALTKRRFALVAGSALRQQHIEIGRRAPAEIVGVDGEEFAGRAPPLGAQHRHELPFGVEL